MTAGRPLSRLPYVLLGAMTLVSFAGPFVVLAAIRGGKSPGWPPDRPVEWGTIAVVLGLEIILFLVCVTAGWWQNRRQLVHTKSDEQTNL
jgi:hypothetical protein